MFPGGISNIQRNHFPRSSKLPQESPVQFPQESWDPSPQAVSLSPVDSGSLSSQSTNASLGFIQRVISLPGYNWVILSQKPWKDHRRRSLLIPSKVYQCFQHNKGIPSKLLSTTQQSTSLPTRVLLPSKIARVLFSPQSNPFAKFIPQRSYLLLPVFLQPSSLAEITSSILQTSAQELISRHPSRIYFPRRKHTFINITSSYTIACLYAS